MKENLNSLEKDLKSKNNDRVFGNFIFDTEGALMADEKIFMTPENCLVVIDKYGYGKIFTPLSARGTHIYHFPFHFIRDSMFYTGVNSHAAEGIAGGVQELTETYVRVEGRGAIFNYTQLLLTYYYTWNRYDQKSNCGYFVMVFGKIRSSDFQQIWRRYGGN